ncbi:MAG: PEP-CTERM system histidine kinase PrsK [Woeseiaceae bacterium]|nr:PEP-CTERM system histidine kinase PrsK [Woeseiaceae bacterium]
MIEIGAASYGLVGVLYAGLCILLLTTWRGQRIGAWLIAACVLSAAWGFGLGAYIYGLPLSNIFIFVLEVLRSGAWIAFLVAVMAALGAGRGFRYVATIVWVGVLVAGVAAWSAGWGTSPGSGMPAIVIWGGLGIALVGLILVEQVYRNTPPNSRWAVKSLVIALGGLFAYDLFLYSQGLLFGVLDSASWLARGAVNLLFVPLLAIAARRNSDWEMRIFVSRQVVFYSTSLIAVGVYLLLMSLGGYLIALYGGTWGELARIVFFVGAAVVLVIMLFSSTLRARLRVFLAKHFFQNKYDYREEWLRLISTLSEADRASTRQVVVKAMSQIVEGRGGVLWALDDIGRTYEPAASQDAGDAAPSIPVDSEIVRFMLREGWLVDLEEYRQNRSLYGDLALPDWLDQIEDAWLIVPLMFDNEMLGLVLLTRVAPRPALNYEDRDLLKTVGNHLAVHLAQEKSDRLLAESQQFEAYNRLTAFLMHDLNNLIAQQSLIIKNAEKHRRNPEFVDDAMQTIANSVERMNRVMKRLKGDAPERTVRKTPLKFIVSAAVDRCREYKPSPKIELGCADAEIEVDSEQVTMVLTHLIRNAQDATPSDGSVGISTKRNGASVAIAISDTGSGMTPQFIRDHLFRPFDSTKGSQGMGIGAYQAREFTRRMGGDIEVVSEVSAGTTVTLTLPVAV